MAGQIIIPVLLLLATGGVTIQAQGPLYPFQNVGTTSPRDDDGSSPRITLQESFNFFGQNYSQIFLNNNGDLTFDAPWSSYIPEQFPRHGGRDIIAPFWVDLDNTLNGDIRYIQHSSGPVLQQVSDDINAYFPALSFHANWVFIATWHEVPYIGESGTETTFQVVLTTDGQFSFVLMNYGSIAPTSRPVQAGYDTADSSHHFSIPGSMTNNAVGSNSFFSLHSNVNVPGRWVFRVDQGSTGYTFNDPCEELHCTEYERCGERDGVYGCFCDEDHHRPNNESYDSNITCSSSSGIMSISRCQLFEAGFHSSALHLQDESCNGTIQDGRLVFHFDNDNHLCGTTLRSNGTHFLYENTIHGDVDTHGVLISRQRTINLRFCCVYPLEQALSMSVGISPMESIVDKKLPFGTGSYRLKMTPYEDEDFLTSFSTNAIIGLEINKVLFVEVKTEGVDEDQLSTILESCWATPVNDADHPVRWDLIDSQCPNPADGTVEVIKNGVSTAARFSFKMFTFTNHTEIYLHCNVHLCLLENNNCTADCSPGHQNRRRRDVSYHDSGSLSLGPLVLGEQQTNGELIYRNGASDHLTSIVTLIVSLLMTRIWAN
ncbi:alpha-tectorin [Fundulus heteroclitus]|uniref:alpha-tectorin n=1 Tax=Fundulus heteroclitus TaxID=8078 RepID=UPI00165A1CFC|nr:alpha-tectorin [Fundulus heteroclitus]